MPNTQSLFVIGVLNTGETSRNKALSNSCKIQIMGQSISNKQGLWVGQQWWEFAKWSWREQTTSLETGCWTTKARNSIASGTSHMYHTAYSNPCQKNLQWMCNLQNLGAIKEGCPFSLASHGQVHLHQDALWATFPTYVSWRSCSLMLRVQLVTNRLQWSILINSRSCITLFYY